MNMTILEMRKNLGDTQKQFAARYGIPFRTIQNWESGARVPSEYVLNLLEKQVSSDLINHLTFTLSTFSNNKKNLPKRSDYLGPISWLKAIKNLLGADIVFALDEALMCQGNFNGRNDESIIWIYGDASLLNYNGVIILGNTINTSDVKCKNGLKFTSFNRTISDAFANESLLDMQGLTESLNKYYVTHNESFKGIYIEPQYQKRFQSLAYDAIVYYDT